MADERVFVELYAHAVPAKFFYHAVAVFMSQLRDGGADITHKAPGLGSLDAAVQTFLGDGYQIFFLFVHPADLKHPAGVGVVTAVNGAYIHVDDVAALQDYILAGDAVADLVVHRGAAAFREAAETQGGGNSFPGHREIINQFIYFFRAHARLNFLGHHIQHGGVNLAGLADAGNLCRGLEHIPVRDRAAPFLKRFNLFFYRLVANFVRFTAATPT